MRRLRAPLLAATAGLRLALLALPAFPALLASACDDTPRGEQGIDYLVDGSYTSVPPARDASVDAHGPCTEAADAGICAQTSSAGTPATHSITCTEGRVPADIVCIAMDDASADGGSFCCTTGLL
jgi:hypothetical protein